MLIVHMQAPFPMTRDTCGGRLAVSIDLAVSRRDIGDCASFWGIPLGFMTDVTVDETG